MPDQANLPSQADLNSLYGAWNPMSYIQGYQNQDLAAQFRDQAFQQQQNSTREGQLKNQQSEAMNPLLINNQVQTNTNLGLTGTGLDIGNKSEKLKLEAQEADQPNLLSKQQRTAALSASEDEMKKFDFHVGELLRSNNPAERDQGAKLQQYLSSFQAERRKAADAFALQQEQSRSHLKGIGMQGATQLEVAKIQNPPEKWAKTGKNSITIEQRLITAKNPKEKAEILETAAANARANGEEELANSYAARAQEARERLAEDFRNQGGAVPKADLGALGIVPTAPPAAKAPIAGGKPKAGTAENPIVLK